MQQLKEIQSYLTALIEQDPQGIVNFNGWGTVHQALEEKGIDQEVRNAALSLNTSYYTRPEYIKFIWDVLVNKMQWQGGRALEPSVGNGRFIYYQPQELTGKTQWVGIDIDPYAIKSCQTLFPLDNFYCSGFERINLATETFDLIISNVPFGSQLLYDAIASETFTIHNYFLLKASRLLKPDGIMAMVVTSSFLDAPKQTVRDLMKDLGVNLIAAYRVPKITEGTEVTADIIFFAKQPISNNWAVSIGRKQGLAHFFGHGINYSRIVQEELNCEDTSATLQALCMNEYFWLNPSHIHGKIIANMYDGKYDRIQIKAIDKVENIQQSLLNQVAENPLWEKVIAPPASDRLLFLPSSLGYVENNTLVEYLDKVYLLEGMVLQSLPKTKQKGAKLLIKLIQSYHDCYQANLEKQGDRVAETQNRLKKAYLNFVEALGYINNPDNIRLFSGIKDYEYLRGLETLSTVCLYDFPSVAKSEHHYQPTSLFYRQLFPDLELAKGSVDNDLDAVILSMELKGKIDLNFIQFIRGLATVEETEKALIPEYCLRDLSTGMIVQKEDYLCGDISQKIQFAEQLIEKTGDNYAQEILPLLKKAHPAFLLPSKEVPSYQAIRQVIEDDGYQVNEGDTLHIINLGWIPIQILERFAVKLTSITNMRVFKLESGGFHVSCPKDVKHSTTVRKKWGTEDRPFHQLFEDLLNLRSPKVAYKDESLNKTVVDQKLTYLAEQKLEEIKQAFIEWIWNVENKVIGISLIYHYNQSYNSFRYRQYDGSKLKLRAQANTDIELKPHQLNGVLRIMQNPSTLLAWDVGSGKTFTMIAAVQELKHRQLINRPLIVAPNATVEQFKREYLMLYPFAKILHLQISHLENKGKLVELLSENWDCILVADSVFDLYITVSPNFAQEYFQKIVSKLNVEKDFLVSAEAEQRTVKKNANSVTKYISKLNELLDKIRKGATTNNKEVYLELLGVDMLIIDEAHNYKNLSFYSQLEISGIPKGSDANKALNTLLKVRWAQQQQGKIVFATATPIANSIAELWVMQEYLIPDLLESRNLHIFDEWISLFGEKSTKSELHHTKGYVAKTRIRQYNNRPEMLALAYQCIDVIDKNYIKTHSLIKKPEEMVVNEVTDLSDIQQDYVRYLVHRTIDVESKAVDPKEDNHLVILTDGRKAMLDERLVNINGKNHLHSKINHVIYNAYRIWDATHSIKGVQLLFSDESTPQKDDRFTVYAYIKETLIVLGIPAEQIAIIHDYDHSNKEKRAILRHQLSKDVNEGNVRIVLGSTEKLGTGINMQKRVISIQHLSIRYRPIDLEQRNGRGIRQGNLFGKVLIFYYVAKGINEASLDSFLWQIIKTKQDFISTALVDDGRRSIIEPTFDDNDEALPAATLMAIAQGNPELRQLNDKRKRLEELKIQQEAIAKAQVEQHLQERQLTKKIDDLCIKLKAIKSLETAVHNLIGQEIKLLNIPVTIGEELKEKTKQALRDSLNHNDLAYSDDNLNIVVEKVGGRLKFVIAMAEVAIQVSLSELFNAILLKGALIKKEQKFQASLEDSRHNLKIVSQQSFQFNDSLELEQLTLEVAVLMEKYGDDGITPDKTSVNVNYLRDFIQSKGKTSELQPLTAEEIEERHSIINTPPHWQSKLEEAIASWQGEDPVAVAEAEAIEVYAEEIEDFDWAVELAQLKLSQRKPGFVQLSLFAEDAPVVETKPTTKKSKAKPKYDPNHPLAKLLLS